MNNTASPFNQTSAFAATPEAAEEGIGHQNEFHQHQQQQQQQQQPEPSILKQSSHPTALIFHYLFRSLAITAYLLCSFFSSNFILNFVIIILLLAFDFWTVKNITGRLLVGLRWWNEIKPDGTNNWVFESRKSANIKPNSIDAKMFWLALYVFLIVWFAFAIVGIIGLKLEWLTIVAIAIVLNMANVVGYTKCDKEAKKRIKNMVGQSLLTTFVSNQFNFS